MVAASTDGGARPWAAVLLLCLERWRQGLSARQAAPAAAACRHRALPRIDPRYEGEGGGEKSALVLVAEPVDLRGGSMESHP